MSTLQRIRTLFRPRKSSLPQETTTNGVHDTSDVPAPDTQNNVGTGVSNTNPSADNVPANNSSHGPPPFNDAPIHHLSIHFTGRTKELGLIEKAFELPGNVPRRCALFGNEGVGKSQLTHVWASSTFAKGVNAYVLWTSATTVEKLYQGFCKLLHFINHPDRSHPYQSVRLAAARKWLEEVDTGNWLLVLDNVVPETLDFLRQHLPRRNGRGTILFTTRTERVAMQVVTTAEERHEMIEILPLDVKDSAELFLAHFEPGKIDPSSAKVEQVIKLLGGLPLAITHAAAFVWQSKGTLDSLLDLLDNELHDGIEWEHNLSEYDHNSVFATFTSNLQDLERQTPVTSNLLRVLAFFDPESIPLYMLTTGADAVADAQGRAQRLVHLPHALPTSASLLALIQSPMERHEAITQLHKRSLVGYHSDSPSPTIRMHNSIQLVVLEDTKHNVASNELFEFAVELACAAFKQIEDPTSPDMWPRCELLAPHIEALAAQQTTSIKAKKQLLLANHRRGRYLASCGRYREVERLYEAAVADMEDLFGLEDPKTLSVMHDLAKVYRSRGRFHDAATLFERVLEMKKHQLEPEDPSTLRTMHCLADVYRDQRRYDDAETLLKQTLRIHETQLGLEHKDTLDTMYRLAIVYHARERYDEAETLLLRALRDRERLFGSEHHSILDTKHSLAIVYQSQGRYAAAAELFQQVLLASETQLGLHHPDTLSTMQCLARAHYAQEHYNEAAELLLRVLGGREQMFGLSHPKTQKTVRSLASVYESLGRYDDARMLKQRISTWSR